MAKKIKIFSRGASGDSDNAFEELEQEVNAWIKNNPNSAILQRFVSTSSGITVAHEGYLNCTIVFFIDDTFLRGN